MKHVLPVILFMLFCSLSSSVVAQQVPWSFTRGDNTLDVSSQGIHVDQRVPNNTNAYALARAKLEMADATAWHISFDVRFGKLRAVGAAVKLGLGDAVIGQVGEHDNTITLYVGNDTVKPWKPLDANWHHFEFIRAGATITVRIDNSNVWHEPSQGNPDNIILGSWWDGRSSPSQQSEVWLRNLKVSTPDLPSRAPMMMQSAAFSPPLPFPVRPILDFTGFDTAALIRETDTPLHPLELSLTSVTLDGRTAGALHVHASNLADHDVLRAPELSTSPAASDQANTVLWARGDAHTSALMFEWDEQDGTRWIATFPINEHWQRVVLSPKDFTPWLVAADRARQGFRPSQAAHFRMGLDASNSHSTPGPHEYWVAQIGIENSSVDTAVANSGSPSQQQIKADLALWLKRFRDGNRESEGLLFAYNATEKSRENGLTGVDPSIAACQSVIASDVKESQLYQHMTPPPSLPAMDQVTLKQALRDAVRSAQYDIQASQQSLLFLSALKPYGSQIADIPPAKSVELSPTLKGFLGQAMSLTKLAVTALDASSASLDEVIQKWGITNQDVENVSASAAGVTGLPLDNADSVLAGATRINKMVSDTQAALVNHQVIVKPGPIFNAFDTDSMIDFSVTNNSNKPVMFWTTPILVFGDGSEGAIQSGMVNKTPFRSTASQFQQAFAFATSPTPYSGPATPVQGQPVSIADDTIIPPGRTLYFHCGTTEGHPASTLVKIKFKGGGWDQFTIDYHVIGVNTVP